MLFGCARTILLTPGGSLLGYRGFRLYAVQAACMSRKFTGHHAPPRIDLFLFFLADSGPKKACRIRNERRNPENRGMARCVVVVRTLSLCATESDTGQCSTRKIADSGVVLRSRGSKTDALQAAARKSKRR
ncbi:hypothetical protein KCP71_16810 [Salmonella enterica subsp. enterica]|nr:hypothetical protein KCP71_16810 [Salmonella enterica subsp. enterica]